MPKITEMQEIASTYLTMRVAPSLAIVRGREMRSPAMDSWIQYLHEVVNINYIDLGKVNVSQNIKMMILTDNKMGIGLKGTIHEFVIVRILFNKSQVKIDLDLQCVGKIRIAEIMLLAIRGPIFWVSISSYSVSISLE